MSTKNEVPICPTSGIDRDLCGCWPCRVWRGGQTRILAANEADPAAIVQMVGASNDVLAIAPISEEVGHATNWFQVSPFGRFPHRVGMQVFDRQAANAIVTLFKSTKDKLARLFRGLPVYVGHPDLDPKAYPDHRKYGSIQDLEVRDDGLWAKPKWSKAGKEIVNDEHYDFQSLLWNMEPVPNEAGAFRPVELISVGLTNRPNIPGKPVGANTAEEDLDPMKREAIIQKLNLKPINGATEVTDQQIEAAISGLQSAGNESATLTEQLRVANEAKTAAERRQGEDAARADKERKARIAEKLTAAANVGRITEAEKAGWQVRFETDFDGADSALSKLTVPAMNTRQTMQTGNLGQRNGGEVAATRAERTQAANEAVDAHMKLTGLGYQAAFNAVMKLKPELFEDPKQA